MTIESRPQRLLLAKPRGLCAGVERSLEAYDRAVNENPQSHVYSVGEPAHNTHINNLYKEKGVIFVDKVSEVPLGAKTLLGPHGTEEGEYLEAAKRNLEVLDTTCPLVIKVEDEIKKYTEAGVVTIYWGDPDHKEAKAAMSSGDVILVRSKEEALSRKVFEKTKGKNGVAFASQTTFNDDDAQEIIDLLKQGFYKDLITPRVSDRCYATRNRQNAVKELIQKGASVVIVVGSETSSNSKRLAEIARQQGASSIFIDDQSQLSLNLLLGHETIGMSSGASVKEDTFREVLEVVKKAYDLEEEEVAVENEDNIFFKRVKPLALPSFEYSQ